MIDSISSEPCRAFWGETDAEHPWSEPISAQCLRASYSPPISGVDRRHVDGWGRRSTNRSGTVAVSCRRAECAIGVTVSASVLTYLNTASLGPTPRAVLNRTLEASTPARVESGVHGVTATVRTLAAADRTRDQAASLLRFSADEMLITRGATDAMNSLAQGIRLVPGDRVLTTDQEHEGGSLGWHYRSRRDGVHLDVVSLAPEGARSRRIVRRFAAAIAPATEGHQRQPHHHLDRIPHADNGNAQLAKNRGALCIVDGARADQTNRRQRKVARLSCLRDCRTQVVDGSQRHRPPLRRPRSRRHRAHSVGGWPQIRRTLHQGVGSLPLAVGLGAAMEWMRARQMTAVESYNFELRNRAYAGLQKISKLRVVSAPPGPLATALVAARLPADIDSRQVRDVLRGGRRSSSKWSRSGGSTASGFRRTFSTPQRGNRRGVARHSSGARVTSSS